MLLQFLSSTVQTVESGRPINTSVSPSCPHLIPNPRPAAPVSRRDSFLFPALHRVESISSSRGAEAQPSTVYSYRRSPLSSSIASAYSAPSVEECTHDQDAPSSLSSSRSRRLTKLWYISQLSLSLVSSSAQWDTYRSPPPLISSILAPSDWDRRPSSPWTSLTEVYSFLSKHNSRSCLE